MPDAVRAVEGNAVSSGERPGMRLKNYLSAVGGLIWKDLAAELRSRELLGAMLVFALLVILIFNFALELQVATRQAITSGVIWTTSE